MPSNLKSRAPHRPTVLFAAILSVFLWASSFPGIKAGLEGYSPLELASLRFVLASLMLAGVAAVVGIRGRLSRSHIPLVALLGFLGVTSYHVALNLGEAFADSNTAAFITSVAPLFTTIIAWCFQRESVTTATWAGLGLGAGGVAILFEVGLDSFGSVVGPTLLFAAAFCWALFFVLQKPLLRHYSSFQVACYAVWAGSLPFLLLIPQVVMKLDSAPLSSTLAAVYLGLGPTALAYVLWAFVLAHSPASRASLITYLTPLISMIISFVWLGERPTLKFFVGAVLILLGVLFGTSTILARSPRLKTRL